MSWRAEWNAISARISALLDAGHIFAQMLQVYSSDALGGAGVLLGSGSETFVAVAEFHKRHASVLPMPAADRLDRFTRAYDAHFKMPATNRDMNFQQVQFQLTALRTLQADLAYLLADTEFVAKNLVSRAFLHLQRALVADAVIRQSWRTAFDEGEAACERLGATHLLLHGIWAFKADALGERTDLVLGTRLEITPQIEGAADALVLTEWKIVRDSGELKAKAQAALSQAKLYSEGSLAGFELASRRYLVIVSNDRLEMPPNHTEGLVEYLYQNIAIAPKAPSVAAKQS